MKIAERMTRAFASRDEIVSQSEPLGSDHLRKFADGSIIALRTMIGYESLMVKILNGDKAEELMKTILEAL